MLLRKLISLILCALLCSLNGYNQNPHFSIQPLTNFKGLECNDFLLKDSRSYVWVSTISSLDRYNGKDIHSYLTGKNTPGDIQGSIVQGNLVEDQYGDIWFATYEAINRYNRLSDDFSAFQVCTPTGDIIKEQYHIFHIDNETDEIWLSADEEIFCLDIRQPSQYFSLPYTTEGRRFCYRNNEDNTISIYAVLSGGYGFDLFTSDGKGNWSCDTHSLDKHNKPKITNGIIENDSIIWMTSRQGLIRFNEKTRSSSLFKADDANPGITDGAFIKKNQLLLSSHEKGLFIFDTEKNSFITNIQNDSTNVMLSNNPTKVHIDQEQQIWVSHNNYGIDKIIIMDKPGFGSWQANTNMQTSGRIKYLHSAGQDTSFMVLTQDKEIFSVTKDAKGYYFNKNFTKIKKALQANAINFLGQDAQKQRWAISPDAVYLYNETTTRKFEPFDDRQLHFLLNLSSGQNLITSTKGLMQINATEDSLQVKNLAILPDKTSYHRLFEHSSGKIMLSINANLLAICSYDEADSLKLEKLLEVGADIFSFYENKATGITWIGTSQGVAKVDTAGTVNFLLQEDWKIGSTNIYAIIEDDKNRLWIASDNGLWSYDLNEKRLNRYREEDGLFTESFSKDAYLKNDDGTIWLGTNNGLLYFHPDSIKLPDSNPLVQIEEAKINNDPYQGDSSITEKKELNLSYYQTTLAFKLNVLDYIYPSYNQFRYRLKGYGYEDDSNGDGEWKMAENGETIKFIKIPAGKHYKLEVVGINAHYRESPLKTLDIKIATPFWQTWWFLFLAIFLIIFIAWSISKAYINKKLRAQQIILDRKKALEKQRKELADDLHDNIGNDLSEILHISDHATLKKPDDMKRELEKIADLTTDSLMNMRFMIHILEIDIDTITGLLHFLREYTNRLFTRHELNYKISFPEKIPAYKIEGNFKWNFSLFFKECFGNIIKHAQASTIDLSVYFEHDAIYVKVKDNGIGFDVNERTGKGKGLSTMKKRAAFFEGTLIIDSIPSQGSSVSLMIPLTNRNDPDN